jgi:ABC-type multidrug transport system ATPase subunit
MTENGLSFKRIQPASLQVRGLSVGAKKSSSLRKRWFHKSKKHDLEHGGKEETHTILHPTSFDVPSGKLMAIIGGSGSGKTTMLNVLAQRSVSKGSLKQMGQVTYNGGSLDHIHNAYVIQQDVLSPNLTTRETLRYAVELRLPGTQSKEERLILVEEVIMELGLRDCAETIVGDSRHKGLSGGEKRRLSIGIQMLANPSLLFLDEPTTGLDANSAYLLIKTLKNLTKRGRTIIISIHQPRSDIFFLFDYLCILSRGQTVYAHKVEYVLSYFEKLGYTVPESMNPADFLIDITAVDIRIPEVEAEGQRRLQEFAKHWEDHSHTILEEPLENDLKSDKVIQKNAPFWRELWILTRRTHTLTIRDTSTLLALFAESIIMGLICGWIYFKPGGSIAGIRTKAASIYSSCALQGYLMLLFEVYRLCSTDIKIFDRERADKCVTIFGFLISRRLAKLFSEDIPISFAFSLITFFMYGMQVNAAKFFIYWLGIFLTHLTSMTGAVFAVSISRNYPQASLVSNMNYTLQSFACGFFVNTKSIPVYTRWTKYIAYLWYSFGAMMVNEFDDFFGDCPYGGISDPQCSLYVGTNVLKNYSFDLPYWILIPLSVVFGWSILFYIIAALILKINPEDISLTKQVGQASSTTDFKEIKQLPKDTGETIDVLLSNVFLNVRIRRRTKAHEKVILNGVNALFKSGKINAIMGPSGSGKSSLLNLISGRISSDLLNRYSSSGDICFNDMKISTDMINSLCSYVSQDDDHLLASLSVRETLLMAAALRLRNMDKDERSRVVDDVIAKLGLRGCANTLIGSEFKKGISGGEKRRVAIGIQLLNNPKVLFLDEPTSGLDSFTASTILEILQNLADEGKTIIITIHQPRSDLFRKFGEVLLLAKGGMVGYNGPQETMTEYFQSLGYPCPKLTNSADHILDLISVNNQSQEQEQVSKKRVALLLESWSHRLTEKIPNGEMVSKQQFKQRFGEYIREPCSLVPALMACGRQQLLTTMRNTDVIMAKLMNPLGVGIVVALWMAPLKTTYVGIQDRLGAIQQFSSLYFCGMLSNLSAYPQQRNYFYHEHADRVHGVLPFFLAYTLLEIPFDIFAAMLTSTFLGPILGLPRTADFYFALSYCSFCIIFCGESLGIITNTLFENAGFAVNSVSIILSIGTFLAGIMSLNMDKVLKGINYISPLKYTTMILVNMGFPANVVFQCSDNQTDCTSITGTQVLELYGLKADYVYAFGVLICVTFIYRLIAYLILRMRLWKINVGAFSHTRVE